MADPYSISQIYGTDQPIPYTDEEIKDLQYVQSVDVMFLAHPNHPPATITRRSQYDWRYEQPEFSHGPYMDSRAEDLDVTLTVTEVLDRATLISAVDYFTIGMVNDLIEYSISGQRVIGQIKTFVNAREVTIEPYEDRCLIMAKQTYSPGIYAGWNSGDSIPTYTNPIVEGVVSTIAFSNSSAVDRTMLRNYLRFVDKDGVYYWMHITAVGDILQQGAYGILATGTILSVLNPSFPVIRTNRTILANLRSSAPLFFDLTTDVGRLFRLVFASEVRHARGVADEDNTGQLLRVSLNLSLPLTSEGEEIVNDGSTNIWQRGSWFTGNYPAVVGFHEGRLTFGRTPAEPQSVWLSKSADFYDFASTNEVQEVLADAAINLPLDSDTMNDIVWLVSRGFLLIGSSGSEWQVGASTNREALTAENATAQVQSSHGSEPAKALSVGRNVLFIQSGGSKVREMKYDYTDDAQSSMDLNTYADHILRDHGGAKTIAYQPVPFPTVYVLLNDGQIGVLAYEPDQQVYAWSRFKLGGTDARATSLSCVPEGNDFVIYATVQRTVNGETQTTIESFLPEFRPTSSTDRSNLKFIDSHREVLLEDIVDGVATGLTDFAGATVNILLDDSVYHDLPVTVGGELALPRVPSTRLLVGYGYRSILKTFPIEVQGIAGTSQGKLGRINAVVFRCINSVGAKYGDSLDTLRRVDFRKDQDPTDVPPPYRTEDIRISADTKIDTLSQQFIVQDLSLPLNILAIFPELSKFQ
jgi:hypothetical protein